MLIAILVVDAKLVLMAKQAQHETIDQAKLNLRVAADVVLARAEQKLDNYDRTLSGIGEVVDLHGGLPAGPDLSLHRLLVRRHAITPGLLWLLLIRENGTLAASSGAYPAPGVTLTDREYFQTQADSWDQGMFIGAPIESRFDQQLLIPMSRRLTNDGSRFIGVIAAGVPPSELEPLLAEQSLPEGYTLRLFLKSGQALVCFPANVSCRDRNWNDSPIIHLVNSGEEQHKYFDSQELAGPERGIGAYAVSDRYPVFVTATVDESRVLAAWHDSLGGYLALALGSNAAIAGIGLIAFRQFQRRRQAMLALAEANQHLEERVASRTEELRRSEAQARTFMDTAMDAVVVIDGHGRIVEFNKAAEVMFGYTSVEIKGSDLGCLIPPKGNPGVGNLAELYIASTMPGDSARSYETVGKNRDGLLFPMEMTLGCTEDRGMPLYVAVIRNITERKEVERELLRLATVDGLTGTLNRRAFSEQAEKLLTLAKRHGRPFALMLLDADHFKRINDTHGHSMGDEVLKALAGILDRQLRSTDLLGRFGGEEFVMALPETDFLGAWELGNRVLEATRECRISAGDREIVFTVSIGIATFNEGGEDTLDSLLKRADHALYQAKERGRNRLAAASSTAQGSA